MVDFGRAIDGPADKRFPDVDRVGYHDEASPDEHGPITSSTVGLDEANVKFHRTEISLNAKLYAVSSNPAILEIRRPSAGLLPYARSAFITFKPLKAGRAAIEVRYNWLDGPVLGRLYVRIYDPLTVNVMVHLVEIDHTDAKGDRTNQKLPDQFLGADCRDRDSRLERAKFVIYGANAIWNPHGIVFSIHDGSDSVWSEKELGEAPINLYNLDKQSIKTAGALSTGRSKSHVNFFCVPARFGNTAAFTVPGISAAANPRQFAVTVSDQPLSMSGIYVDALYTYTGNDIFMLDRTIAHELGHYMTLVSRDGGHSTDDDRNNFGIAFRDDSVTRQRLLYPEGNLTQLDKTPWRNDVGYGYLNAGALVTHRALPPAQDVTLEESSRARASINHRDFYW
ncbi:MAG TPA: hypothetical protein VGL72_02990 [Bryobacteraceae bacterium]